MHIVNHRNQETKTRAAYAGSELGIELRKKKKFKK